jgi:ribonuclease HII
VGRLNLYRRERALSRALGGPVAGVDEVGRGPLAGPVVAAAVVLPAGLKIPGLNDSKQIEEAQRNWIFQILLARAEDIGVGWATTGQVDRMNILRASHHAMARAVARLSRKPAYLLVDGLPVFGLPGPYSAVFQGDAQCACIAAASIVAKVVRDRFMTRLARSHPAYGFDRNKGYGTEEHREALAKDGPCDHHRRSFAPVRESLQTELAL